MNLKQWISNNISSYNSSVHTEEDLKVKVLLPFLKELGYSSENIKFEHGIDVTIGSKKQLFTQTLK